MVQRCVAAGCSSTHKEGVSLYSFPKDAGLRKKRAEQVKRTRDKWEPTEHSRLCSLHFEDYCFQLDCKLHASMGLGKKKTSLKPGAVPTIFEKPALKRKIPLSECREPKRRRVAYEKRERSRVSNSRLRCKVLSMLRLWLQQ